MRVQLEIQTTTPARYARCRRTVELLALPGVGDRIAVEFWSEGLRVRSRGFTLDGGVVLDLGWHPFDDDERAELERAGWEAQPKSVR